MEHLEFETLSMMDLRGRPGEILDRVSTQGQAFLIERNGQQMACLVPVGFLLPNIERQRVAQELEKLEKTNERPAVSVNSVNELLLKFRREGPNRSIELTIVLPHGYPNKSPRVSAAPLDDNPPHRWQDGSLCIYGAMTAWNPGKHDVVSVLAHARQWLEHYTRWRKSGRWPREENS